MRYNDSVAIRNTAKAAVNTIPPKPKRMCSYRLQSPKSSRTHSPYTLATRAAYLHTTAKTHPPPCKGIKTKQNQIESRQQSSNPSIDVRVNRNQCKIRTKFDPATPASNTIIVITVSTASHVQFVMSIGISKMSGAGSSVCTTTRSRRCRCRCRTINHNKCYQSVNNAITTNLCC